MLLLVQRLHTCTVTDCVCVCVKCQAMVHSTGDGEVPVCQILAAVAGSCFGVKTIAYLQARLVGQCGPVIMLQLTGCHGPGRQSLRAGFGPRAGLCRPLVYWNKLPKFCNMSADRNIRDVVGFTKSHSVH